MLICYLWQGIGKNKYDILLCFCCAAAGSNLLRVAAGLIDGVGCVNLLGFVFVEGF